MMTEIGTFFDKKSIDRNLITTTDPVLKYEQEVRSQMVISMVDPRPGELVLDVGCANGRDLIQLAHSGCKSVGIDLSDKMIDEARKELLNRRITTAEAETGDATNLRFSDETFDKVFASEVLEHIPNYSRAISEMARVLKPAGHLVITTPNRRSIYGFDRYVLHQTLLRRTWHHPYDAWKTFNELASALDNNGFTIVSISGICYIPGFFISYRLPGIMKKVLVGFVGTLEPYLSRLLPKNGYLLAIKATKQ